MDFQVFGSCEPWYIKYNNKTIPAEVFGEEVCGSNKPGKNNEEMNSWGCWDRHFEPNIWNPDHAAIQYGIDENKYNEICNYLVKEFYIGNCGDCI